MAASPATNGRSAPPLRVGVVGTGAISHEHLAFLSGRSPFPQIAPVDARLELAAVCDLSPAAARHAADHFGADAAFTDFDRFLAQGALDVVHVLTPPETHVRLAGACLEAGAHVICEKPITADAAELRALLAVADRSGRHLMESHNYRFNPGVQQLRALLDAGRLGTVREVEIRIVLPVLDADGRFADPHLPHPIHRMPAGVLHDFITHMAYLLLYLAEPTEIGQVSAIWNNHSGHPVFAWDNLDAVLVFNTADGPAHGRLRFDAGAAPDTFSIQVRGTDGWAETDLFQPYLRTVRPRAGGGQLSPIANHVANGIGLATQGVRNIGRKLLQQSPYHGLHVMLDQTYRALATGGAPPVTAADMLATADLIDSLVAQQVRR
jgi:predicted dehydrogenase